MAKLPLLSGRQVKAAFEKAGWNLRTTKRRNGSHLWVLEKAGYWNKLPIMDIKEIKRGTLRGLISASGMSRQEFLALL